MRRPRGDRRLAHRDAFLAGAVVIGVVRNADLARRLDQRLEDRLARLRVGDPQRTLAAAIPVVAVAVIALHALEEGQDLLVAPAAVAHLRPGVEVLRLAAHEGHAVDRAGAAEQFAARHRDAAAVGVGLGLRRIEPVGRRIVDQPGRADRDERPGMARPPRLRAAAPCCAGRPTAGAPPPPPPNRRRQRCSRSCSSSRAFLLTHAPLPHQPSAGHARCAGRDVVEGERHRDAGIMAHQRDHVGDPDMT